MELLLDQTFAFTLADVRKNILVPFRVDRDFDHLAICLHYGPKAIRDPEIIMPQIRKCVENILSRRLSADRSGYAGIPGAFQLCNAFSG